MQINFSTITSERFVSMKGGLAQVAVAQLAALNPNPWVVFSLASLTHPLYDIKIFDWFKFRMIYEGGENFIDEYLIKYSTRETNDDFIKRKRITPTPAFAKGAINEIKNAIFQRAADITREGGPTNYAQSCSGELGGVDLKGDTMNHFIGEKVIPELLVLGKVGVYIDMFALPDGATMADKGAAHPYLYTYRAEDIRSWTYAARGHSSEFHSILLRDYAYIEEPLSHLPLGEIERYRHVYLNEAGYVEIQFIDQYGNNIDAAGNQGGLPITLNIKKIPFVIFDIGDSLLKDVVNHQIALLNMESSDVDYTLKSNYPFYIEQDDGINTSKYLRTSQEGFKDSGHLIDDNLTVSNLNTPSGPVEVQESNELNTGNTQGRRYPKGTDAPTFIAPPTEPLEASMAKQEAIKKDIRLLVHLALSNMSPKMASAESKGLDLEGLESGLAFIGLQLERGERFIAQYWAMYEGSLNTPTVKYPTRWSLKTFEQIMAEIKSFTDIRNDIPSKTARTAINCKIIDMLDDLNLTNEQRLTITTELRLAKGSSGDPKIIQGDMEAGLLSLDTGCDLRGYPEDEPDKAAKDHALRLARIQAAQTGAGLKKAALKEDETADEALPSPEGGDGLVNPAARGVPDYSVTPSTQAASEKNGKRQRGKSNDQRVSNPLTP